MAVWYQLSLLIAVVLAFESLANPSIRIGGTLAKCGPTSELSVLVDDALHWWANSINARGGVIINGTLHDVEFVIYDDAGDADLLPILYERLILIDQVNALLSPLGVSSARPFQLAAQYEIPIVNAGDLSFSPLVNGTFNGWLFTAYPETSRSANACLKELQRVGVTSLASIRGESFPYTDISSQVFFAESLGIAFTGEDTLYANSSNINGVLSTVKAASIDALSCTLPFDAGVEWLGYMYQAKYFPKAILMWVGPTFDAWRSEASWKAGSVIVPSIWGPTLNFSDPDFGSSQGFYDAFQRGLNRTPDTSDLLALHATTALKLAFERASSLNSLDVRQAMLELNTETWFGRINFSTPGFAQQTNLQYYCFQLDETGRSLDPISPNAGSWRSIVYPALVNVPSGFYRTTSNKKRNLTIGLSITFGLLLIASLLGLLIFIQKRYQVIFVPKVEGEDGEW